MLDLGGTFRTVPPEVTLTKVEPLLWKEFGITRIANITGLDHIEIPTYIAIRPHAKLLTTSQGKGHNHPLAKISAIMESIEGWHCENMLEPSLWGSFSLLRNDYPLALLHPHMNHGPFEWVNIESLEIPWAKGIELLSNQEIYFPHTSIHVNTAHYRPGYRYFPPTTNGLASGNTIDEAICHALFEILEREFEACHVNFSSMPYVDLKTIRSPFLLELLAKIERAKLRLEVWDMSTDMKIPAYFAVLHDLDDLRNVGMIMGTGAHFSSVVALSRAITEAVQGRATIISGSRDDQTPRLYKKIKKKKPRLLNRFESTKKTTVPFFETKPPVNFKVCREQLLALLQKHGFKQVILYDHTRAAFDLPVVHVVVPGLRYIHGSCFSCPVSLL